jgi:hypothetical protein
MLYKTENTLHRPKYNKASFFESTVIIVLILPINSIYTSADFPGKYMAKLDHLSQINFTNKKKRTIEEIKKSS